MSSPWILWNDVCSTLQSGRYTLSYNYSREYTPFQIQLDDVCVCVSVQF